MRVYQDPCGEWAANQGRQRKLVQRHMPKRLAAGLEGPFFHPEYVAPTWFLDGGDLRVMTTVEKKADGSVWYHVSVVPQDKEPRTATYAEMARVRLAMFKPSATVISVFPPLEEHVSDHDYSLHLWSRCTKGRWLPDLREMTPEGSLSV